MSRQYDERIDRFPENLSEKKYAEHYNTIYRAIEDHPCYYATNDGEIISCVDPDHPRIMKTWTNRYGHEYVRLIGPKNTKETILVHREVAKAFIPNPEKHPIVRHMDDRPWNNAVDNLAWGTQKDNVQDMLKHNRARTKSVVMDDGTVYKSCAEAANALGVTRSFVTLCCQTPSRSIKGRHMRYLEEARKASDGECN